MRQEEYRNLFLLEDIYWRYIGLKEIVTSFLDKFCITDNQLNILDAGCGTGMILSNLKNYGRPIGIDISEQALSFCKKRNFNKLSQASIVALPFKDNYFDLIVTLDVIYHRDVNDDSKALAEVYRVLKKGGKVVINVPAYNYLNSSHDKAVYTRHRYLKKELKDKVGKTGFKIEKITYWNTFLFPLIAFIRIIRKIIKANNCKSDVRVIPQLFNSFLTKMIIFEAQLLSKINFPYGLSIICLAKK